jgi:hypothetical protein
MRKAATLLTIALLTAVGLAQDNGGKPAGVSWENQRYRIKAVAPAGWTHSQKETKSRGNWIELGAFTETRSGAKLSISVQASQHKDADEMIEDLRGKFGKDAGLAVLRDEVRPATSKRPKGILFEYTYQYGGKPQHAVAVYWLHRGRRIRVYGTVREVGWRSAGGDLRDFVKSVEFTAREFTKEIHNYVDETQNFRMYFPEDWSIRLPARGPRVIFESKKLGVGVWVYVGATQGRLSADLKRLKSRLEEGGATVTRKRDPSTHPDLGIPTAHLEYTKSASGAAFKYHETLLMHRERFYRIVLAASTKAFKSGEEAYARMVRSFNFMK